MKETQSIPRHLTINEGIVARRRAFRALVGICYSAERKHFREKYMPFFVYTDRQDEDVGALTELFRSRREIPCYRMRCC